MAAYASACTQLRSLTCDTQGAVSEEFLDTLGMYTWIVNTFQSFLSDRRPNFQGRNGVVSPSGLPPHTETSNDSWAQPAAAGGSCVSGLGSPSNRKRNFHRAHLFSDESEIVPAKRQRLDLLSTIKKIIYFAASFLKLPSQFSEICLKLFRSSYTNENFNKRANPYFEGRHRKMSMEAAQKNKLFFDSRVFGTDDDLTCKTMPCISTRPMDPCNPLRMSIKYHHRSLPEHRFPWRKATQDNRFIHARLSDPSKTFKKLTLTVDEDVQKEEREKYMQLLELVKGGYHRKNGSTELSHTNRSLTLTENTQQNAGPSGPKLNNGLARRLSPSVEKEDLASYAESCLCLNDDAVSNGKETSSIMEEKYERFSEMGKRIITKDMEKEIKHALEDGDPGDILSSAFKLKLTRQDFWTLKSKHWLNDEIINFYMNLLIQRSKENSFPKLHSFSTFFYPKLLSGGYQAVRRWTKDVNLFEKDIILVPIHLDVHWSLLVCDFRKKTIKYYDSIGQEGDYICKEFLKYLQEESKVKRKQSLDNTKWKLHSMKPHVRERFSSTEIPQQRNGSDCGVFACKYADYISRDKPINFTQSQMADFRQEMVWEILHQKLL